MDFLSTYFLCCLGRNKKDKQTSRCSITLSAPEALNEVTQFRGEAAMTGDLPFNIFQRPARSDAALVPFTTHRGDECSPPPRGFGNELISWSVALLDAKPDRTCEELERLLTTAIRKQVPDSLSVDVSLRISRPTRIAREDGKLTTKCACE